MKIDNTDANVLHLRERRASVAEARASQVVNKIVDLGLRQFGEGTVLFFAKKLGRPLAMGGVKCYNFAALRAGEGWYVTGTSGCLSVETFEELLAQGEGFERFTVLMVGVPPSGVLPHVDGVVKIDGES